MVHGTADTIIHPQHSMMLVRGVMQQQQQHYVPTGHGSSSARRNSNSTPSGGRAAGGFPTRPGAIRISQLVLPDADLSNSRMITGVENNSPIDHHHQLLHSVYSHVTQYLASECFTGVGDGIRGRGVRIRGRRLRKRRRRRWRTSNRDQEKTADQKHQQREEGHQQYQQNLRSVNNGESNAGDFEGNNPNTRGRFRRHDIDSSQNILDNSVKDHIKVKQIKSDSHGSSDNNKTNSFDWGNKFLGNHNSSVINNKNRGSNESKGRKKFDNDDSGDDDEEDDENEDSDQEYEDENDSDEEVDDDDDGDNIGKDDDK